MEGEQEDEGSLDGWRSVGGWRACMELDGGRGGGRKEIKWMEGM
jgi:hypothetical protein